MMKNKEEYKTKFDRLGKRWRESVDKVKEYKIIEDEEEEYREFIPFITSGIDYREYQRAEKLKQRLMEKYKGKTLEDIIECNELKTKMGTCYYIETQSKIRLNTINKDLARKRILSDLKLIRGIGEVTERILKKKDIKP